MIALVSCYFQHNYGSQLQALATEMAVRKLGFEAETICIDGLRKEIAKAKYRYFLSKIFDWQTVKDKMATVRRTIARKLLSDYARNMAMRDALFDKFAKNRFSLSLRYDGKSELGKNAHKYDAFIVGSDQLWLPSNIAADYYTLSFVPEDVRKVAYATSFGVSSLPEKYKKKAKTFLSRFNSIMLREESGQRIVKEVLGTDAPLVADPTLLFDAKEWNEVLPKNRRVSEPYMLCYFLGNNPVQREFATRLSKELGLKIVQLPHLDEYVRSDEGFADYPLYDVDPLGFASLIRDADYVLTDSFHCTVFSNIFSRPFFSFRRYSDDGTASTNGRLYSLLTTLGQGHRMLKGTEPIAQCLSLTLDFVPVHERIATLRADSLEMLRESLMS